MHEIYVIRNVRTGKRYVGHAPDLETRWILHLAAADAAYTTRRIASPLQRALLEDGPDAFCREVVARAPEADPENMPEVAGLRWTWRLRRQGAGSFVNCIQQSASAMRVAHLACAAELGVDVATAAFKAELKAVGDAAHAAALDGIVE